MEMHKLHFYVKIRTAKEQYGEHGKGKPQHWMEKLIHVQVAIFWDCIFSVKWENCSERHSQSKWFFLKTNSKKNLRNGKKIDNGKNYSFKRDNFNDIPLTGKFNKEANDCGLVHWNFITLSGIFL